MPRGAATAIARSPAQRREALLVLLAAAFAIVLWAGTATATRIVVEEIDPLMVGALRTVGAAAAAIPLLLLLRLKGPRDRHDWLLLLLSAIGSFVLFPLLFSLGAARTSASHASLIQAAMPIFTGLTAALVEQRRPGTLWWAGAFVAFAGETALIGAHEAQSTAAATAIGDLLILAACLASGSGYVAGARLAARITPVSATFWVITVGSVLLIPLVIWRWPLVNWGAIDLFHGMLMVYLSLGTSVLCFIAWYWALARGGIGRVAVLQFAQPILSVLLAVWLLGERVTLPLLLAGAAILAGIALARLSRA